MLIFFKINFFINSFRNTIRVSNSLDPDQELHSVSPDLGQTVCKDYQQTTKIAASNLLVLILYVPVNNFSVMSGLVFLCLTSTKQ